MDMGHKQQSLLKSAARTCEIKLYIFLAIGYIYCTAVNIS